MSTWLTSVGVVHDTFHVRSAHLALSCRYTHYVVTTRDPVARTISAFNFRHVLGGITPGTKTSLAEHELYIDCFPELPGGVSRFAESLDGMGRCSRLARACLYEPARDCVHLGRGHAYYLQSTGLMEVCASRQTSSSYILHHTPYLLHPIFCRCSAGRTSSSLLCARSTSSRMARASLTGSACRLGSACRFLWTPMAATRAGRPTRR